MTLGGHSPGLMTVVVDTNIGRVALASDLILIYENLEYKWPSGTVFDLEATLRGYNHLLCETDHIIPGHDWEILERFPNGIIG